jgi:hypothetical protein
MRAITQFRIFCLPSAVCKRKDWNIQIYNFACYFVWVWNLVSHHKGSTFWYSGHGGETDVSLDRGRFFGPFVRPRMRMREGVNEWINFFFNFWKSGAHSGMILTGENRRTRRKTCPSATLSTTNPTGLTWARTQAAAVRGRRLTAWVVARPREVHTLRVPEYRVLRRIFKPKRMEVTLELRKLHNDELHNAHSSLNVIMSTKSRSWSDM